MGLNDVREKSVTNDDNGYLSKLFIIVAIFSGVMCIILSPPFSTPDEKAHLINAYTFATGEWFPREINGIPGKGIPEYFQDYLVRWDTHEFLDLTKKFSFVEWSYLSWMPIDAQAKKVAVQYYGSQIFPLGYIGTIPGIGLALLFGGFASPYNIAFCGKLANLLLYTAGMGFCIKCSPRYNEGIFAFGLMPMNIYQAASLSYDAPLTLCTTGLFVIVLRIILLKETQVSKQMSIYFLASALLLISVKQVYFFLLGTLFFIPQKKFQSKKSYVFNIAGVVASALLGLLAMLSWERAYQTRSVGNLAANQLQWITKNPIATGFVILNSIKKYSTYYMVSFFGSLGELNINFPMPLLSIYWIIAALYWGVTLSSERILSYKNKMMLFAIILATLTMMFIGLYISWTSNPGIGGIGYATVEGVQGRYFSPIYLFIVFLFSNAYGEKLFSLRGEQAFRKVQYVTRYAMVFSAVMFAMLTWIILWLRFW